MDNRWVVFEGLVLRALIALQVYFGLENRSPEMLGIAVFMYMVMIDGRKE